MPQPNRYRPSFSFRNHSAQYPRVPQPGTDLDTQFSEISATTDEIITNLALVQRDDGQLADKTVGRPQLKEDIVLGFNAPTTWAPNTDYPELSTVFYDSKFWSAVSAHKSGATFNASNWTLIADFTAATAEARDWAEKMDGPVEGSSYSAKWWANNVSTGVLDQISNVWGALAFRGEGGWEALTPSSGWVLQSNGPNADPALVDPLSLFPSGAVIQTVRATYGGRLAIGNIMPYDDTIPQSTEGLSVISASITRKLAGSKIRGRVYVFLSNSIDTVLGVGCGVAVFRGAGTSAIAATFAVTNYARQVVPVSLEFIDDTPGVLPAQTYSVRCGPHTTDSGNMMYAGGDSTSRKGGGLPTAVLVLEEIKA